MILYHLSRAFPAEFLLCLTCWMLVLRLVLSSVPTMFSMAESKPHSHRKRMMSNVYAKSSIQSSPGFAAACHEIVHARLLPLMGRCLGGGESNRGRVDLYEVLNFATMDLVNAYIFGLSNGSDFLQNQEKGRWWLRLYASRKKFVFWVQELPSVTAFCRRLGIRLSPQWVADANSELEQYCMSMCDSGDHWLSKISSKADSGEEKDVPAVYRQLKDALMADEAKGDKAKRDPSSIEAGQDIRLMIASEMLDQLSAGHETSAITLTYLFWELIQHQNIQEELRAELKPYASDLKDSSNPLPPAKAIDTLPYLHAVLMETLRLHPAIPGPEPRITSCTKDGHGVTLGTYSGIPPNVRVSSQPYSLHRNPFVFPDPESFKPDRWLSSTESQRAEMHRWFWAFSSGGRMCIGSNLAMQQMKLLVAVLVSNFRLLRVVDDGPEKGGIEQEDAYTARPMGEKLVVEIERV